MKITGTQLRSLLYNEELLTFTVVEEFLTGYCEDDGGAAYKVVIHDSSTNKFYSIIYTQWEAKNWNSIEMINFKEVVPTQITITVYE